MAQGLSFPPTTAGPGTPRRWPARWALAAIVALAFALRFWGLDFGLPHPLSRPDEEKVIECSVRMLRTGSPYPCEFSYPGLVKYLEAAALLAWYGGGRLRGEYDSIEQFLEAVTLVEPGRHYYIGRLVNVLFGAATVLVVYAVARRLARGRAAGLLAAFFLAVGYLHARDSHFATIDIVMTFFVTLTLHLSVRAAQRGDARSFWSAGLAAGLAVASKYNALLVGATIVHAAWIAARRFERTPAPRPLLWRLGAAGSGACAGVLIGAPYMLLTPHQLIETLRANAQVLYSGPGQLGLWVHLGHTLPDGLGLPVFALALAGCVLILWRRQADARIVLTLILAFCASVAATRWVMPRYILPVVPALTLLAGLASADFLERGARSGFVRRAKAEGSRPASPWARTQPIIVAAMAVALATPSLARIVAFDRLAAREDTRVQAARWVQRFAPPRSRILLCAGYGAPVLNRDPRYGRPFHPRLADCAAETLANARATYLITHEHPLIGGSRPVGFFRRNLPAEWRLLVRFDPFSYDSRIREPFYFAQDAVYVPFTGLGSVLYTGPIVEIWRREPEGPKLDSARRPG
jgi:hypothetical protein